METAVWMSYIAVAVLTWYPTYEFMTHIAPAVDAEERVIARCVAALVACCWPVVLPAWGAWHLSRPGVAVAEAEVHAVKGGDSSWHAGIGAPYGWGPGPWDDDYLSPLPWRDRAEQFGNLRSWSTSEPLEGQRVISEEFTGREIKDRVRHAPRHPEVVLVLCWCERDQGEVPVEWIREGRTYECDVGCWVRHQVQERRRLKR